MTLDYAPVIDVSKWQGKIDFSKMRQNGVEGVIVRAGNGVATDPRLLDNIKGVRGEGLALGLYWFCNPKASGKGTAQGELLAAAHNAAHAELPPMMDVENYEKEPSKGYPSIYGERYAEWLRQMRQAIEAHAEAPFMYTNKAYWDGPNPQRTMPNVGASDFGDMHLICARYPWYDPVSARAHVPPVNAQQWDDWLMLETSKRPVVPKGWITWSGWQFSAGFNGRAATYGCQGDDLDLNIVRRDVWNLWLSDNRPVTPPKPAIPVSPPVQGVTFMHYIIFNIVDDDEQFGGFGRLLQNGNYFVPEVVWLTPQLNQHHNDYAIEKPLAKSDLSSVTLVGPVPAGYETAFGSYA